VNGPLEIRLVSRRQNFGQRLQLIQDVVGVIVLAPPAWARLHTTGLSLALAAVEIIVIVLAVISAASELKAHEESGGRIDWTNLFLGVALMLEYGFSLETGHKWFSPLFVTAVTMLALSFIRPLLMSRRRARSVIRIDDHGFAMRAGPFRRLNVKWADVESIEDSKAHLRFRQRHGPVRKVRLRGLENADEVRSALLAQARSVSVPIVARQLA